MLIRSSILVELAAVASSADILVVPEHEQYTGAINLGSIVSDDEIVAELDYLEFKTDRSIPSGVNLICPDCPFAVQGTESDKYTFTDTDVQTIIEVVYDTANNRLNLNGNPFLGSQLEDLHLPQTTVQSASFPEDYPEAYTGPLPITYNEQVVQVRTIQLQDGSLVEFYSIDVEVLSIGGRPINVAKVNSHIVKRGDGELAVLPFTDSYDKYPTLPAVPVPDFPPQSSGGFSSSTESSRANSTPTASSTVGIILLSGAAASTGLPVNGTSGGPTVASHTSPPIPAFTGAASSVGTSLGFIRCMSWFIIGLVRL